MTAILLFVGIITLLGFTVAWSLDRSLAGESLIGAAFLCGSGLVAYALLSLSVAGIRWSPLFVVILTFGVTAVAGALARRSTRGLVPVAAPPFSWPSLAINLLIIILVAGHAVYATGAPIPEWDFWAIWGLKGKVFLLERGIDWEFLRNPDHVRMHPDYPVLLPLLLAAHGLVIGGWEDRWAGLLFTAFGVAALLVARRCFREDGLTPLPASLATLGLTGCALTPWVGMAEAPLIAFSGGGLLLVRRGLNRDQASSTRLGAVMLGLAAATKNEGLAFLIAVAIAVAVSSSARRRDLLRLWPAAVVALPWLVIRAVMRLQTDLFTGSLVDRARERLAHMGDLLGAISEAYVTRSLFWTGILAAVLLLAFLGRLRRERFIVTACLVQLGFYLGSYVITVLEPGWHIVQSWPRLLDHVALPLGYIAFANLFLLVQHVPKELAHEREPHGTVSAG